MDDGDRYDIRDSNGKYRIIGGKCGSCIFRSVNDGSIKLPSGRRGELIKSALDADTYVVCHSTIVGDADRAMCGGFWEKHQDRTLACRVMKLARAYRMVPAPHQEK